MIRNTCFDQNGHKITEEKNDSISRTSPRFSRWEWPAHQLTASLAAQVIGETKNLAEIKPKDRSNRRGLETANLDVEPRAALYGGGHDVVRWKETYEVLDVVAHRRVRGIANAVQALRRVHAKKSGEVKQGMLPVGLVGSVDGSAEYRQIPLGITPKKQASP